MTRIGRIAFTRVGRTHDDRSIDRTEIGLMADIPNSAQIGRDWYIPAIGHWKQALAYGDQCWSKILSNWSAVRDQGLTEHENWWPNIYRQACRNWGIEADRQVLAYAQTYEDQRADLRTVAGSA